MNWVADENIESVVVDRLRRFGHSVLYVAETSPGVDDDQVFRNAEARGAAKKAKRLLEMISQENDRLIGAFAVIGPRTWRVRERPRRRAYTPESLRSREAPQA